MAGTDRDTIISPDTHVEGSHARYRNDLDLDPGLIGRTRCIARGVRVTLQGPPEPPEVQEL